MVVPVVLVMFTPPMPEPVTVMASNALVPRSVPVRVKARGVGGGDRDLAGGAKVTVPGVVEPHAGRAVGADREVRDANVPVVASSSRPGLGAEGAGVDDVDVVDGGADVAGAAGDAASGAARIDVEAADLVAVVEVDDVRAGRGQGRVGARVGGCRVSRRASHPGRGRRRGLRVRRSAAHRRSSCSRCLVARRGVVSVEHEHRVVGARGGLGLGERVERGAGGPAVAGASLLLTYHTQPATAIVTGPVSVPARAGTAVRRAV